MSDTTAAPAAPSRAAVAAAGMAWGPRPLSPACRIPGLDVDVVCDVTVPANLVKVADVVQVPAELLDRRELLRAMTYQPDRAIVAANSPLAAYVAAQYRDALVVLDPRSIVRLTVGA